MKPGVLAFATVLVVTAPVATATQATQRELANEAAQRIRQLQNEADALAQQTSSVLTELRRLELQRQIKAEELKKADAELSEVSRDIEQATARLATIEAERLSESPWVREHLVALYKRGRVGYLRVLLDTDDVRAMARMSRGVAARMAIDRTRLDAYRETLRAHRAAVSDLQAQRTKAQAARVTAQNARVALDQAVAAHNRRLDNLDRERDLAARYIGELQAAQRELQRSISALPGNAPVLPLAPFRGALDWPVTGNLLSPFGRSTSDRLGGAIARDGIEIATSEGAAVHAVHAGTVSFAGPFSGFATLVIVDHGQNAYTLYGHLSQATVTKGTRVGRNDVIGRAGRTTDGLPAMYFELRIDGRPVDPVQWLRSQR